MKKQLLLILLLFITRVGFSFTLIDFKVGDWVVFKKTNELFIGKISDINNNNAVIEYVDPISPDKLKEYIAEISTLIKVKIIKEKNDLELKMMVFFKNNNSGKLYEGYIAKITGTTALIEYTDPSVPNKILEQETEFSKIFIAVKSIQKESFKKTKSEKNPAKSNVENLKPAKIKPDYLKHIIAVNGLQFAFKRASIWYEYKFKELIGLRIPIYIDWDAPNGSYYNQCVFSVGINPKFYFNRNKIIKGFAGVEVIAGINPTKYKNLGDNFYYMDFLGDVGISINPIKHLNITVNCGAGINIDLGQHINTKALFSYYPGISIGYNF